jgi:hypothetical protein
VDAVDNPVVTPVDDRDGVQAALGDPQLVSIGGEEAFVWARPR